MILYKKQNHFLLVKTIRRDELIDYRDCIGITIVFS